MWIGTIIILTLKINTKLETVKVYAQGDKGYKGGDETETRNVGVQSSEALCLISSPYEVTKSCSR